MDPDKLFYHVVSQSFHKEHRKFLLPGDMHQTNT